MTEKIGCQYDWFPEVRNSMKIAAAMCGITMSEFSEICIKAGCKTVSMLRMMRDPDTKTEKDELINEIANMLMKQPEGLKIIQQTLLSF